MESVRVRVGGIERDGQIRKPGKRWDIADEGGVRYFEEIDMPSKFICPEDMQIFFEFFAYQKEMPLVN